MYAYFRDDREHVLVQADEICGRYLDIENIEAKVNY